MHLSVALIVGMVVVMAAAVVDYAPSFAGIELLCFEL
jgi:hypothetical protein